MTRGLERARRLLESAEALLGGGESEAAAVLVWAGLEAAGAPRDVVERARRLRNAVVAGGEVEPGDVAELVEELRRITAPEEPRGAGLGWRDVALGLGIALLAAVFSGVLPPQGDALAIPVAAVLMLAAIRAR